MIGVIDYGIGNIGSILNMFKKVGAKAIPVKTVDEIKSVDKLVLPGVGAFDTGIQKLRKSGLVEAILDFALVDEKPLMGICLGMQMLGRTSEEGVEKGLGLIPFESKKFQFDEQADLKIPHMGWNRISEMDENDPMILNLPEKSRFYFVHSYYAVCDNHQNELMVCDYGFPFAAAVRYKKIYGFQFHPEKSHKFGMVIFENFSRGL